jgi:NAD(P)-dependent dehydrogenase (short-subunit alcohol dehydrogenase family)
MRRGEPLLTNNGELHIVFGTGPVRMSVMEELVKRGRQIRMVNRSGRASVPEGVEVVGGDATDETFAREASRGASVVYFALNPPYTRWSELFPPLQAGVVEGAASAGAKLIAVENLYMYGLTGGRPLTEDLPHAPNTRKGTVRAAMAQELMEAQQDHGHGVGQYGSERGDGRPRPGQGRGGQGRHQREERQRLGGPRTGRRVHNNAGVYRSERSTTADGMEETFAVNHLAYFLLTNLLLDKLEAGAPPRIVNVASADHSNATIDFDSLQGEKGYRGARAYSQSKLANVLFTYELARRLQGTGVTANCLQPGVVDQPRQRGLWGLRVRGEGVAALMTSPRRARRPSSIWRPPRRWRA